MHVKILNNLKSSFLYKCCWCIYLPCIYLFQTTHIFIYSDLLSTFFIWQMWTGIEKSFGILSMTFIDCWSDKIWTHRQMIIQRVISMIIRMSHLIGTQKKACFLENDWKVSEKLWQINWDLRYKWLSILSGKRKKSILHRKKKSFEREQPEEPRRKQVG